MTSNVQKKVKLNRSDKAVIMDLVGNGFSMLDMKRIAIQSMSKKNSSYIVELNEKGLPDACNCPDHTYNMAICKHMRYAELLIS